MDQKLIQNASTEDVALYQVAREMLPLAYAPYSRFQVGAALRTKDGRIYTGCNIENATFGATNCAERTAVFKAVSEGCREFDAIAIASSGGAAMPCGICRQVLAEFAPGIRVITGDDEENLQSWKLAELLPYSFQLEED